MSIEFAMDDRRDGVEEGERRLAGQRADGGGERRRSERPGGDDDVVPVGGRQAVDLLASNLDQRMGGDRRRDGRRKAAAVDGERAASRQFMRVGGAHDQGVEPAHLLDAACRWRWRRGRRRETNWSRQFGEVARSVRRRLPRLGPHLMQHDGHAAAGDLPRGLRAGEAAADDVDGAVRFI